MRRTPFTNVDPLRTRAVFLRWLRPDRNVLHVVVDGCIVIDRTGTSRNTSQGALDTLGAYNLLLAAQSDGEGPEDMEIIIIRRNGRKLRCIVGRETDGDGHGHGYAVMFVSISVTIKIIRRTIRCAIRDAWNIRHRRLVTPRPRNKTA